MKFMYLHLMFLGYFLIMESSLNCDSKTSLITLFFMFSLAKFLAHRNHLLNYLIMIEVYMVLMYFNFVSVSTLFSSSAGMIFFFMVIMVCGACVGMSILVMITRMMNKELEISYITYSS